MILPPVAKKNQCGIVHLNNRWWLCDHEPPRPSCLNCGAQPVVYTLCRVSDEHCF